MGVAIAAIALSGCLAPYAQGSLLAQGHHGRRLECIEIDARPATDLIGATSHVGPDTPIFEVAFGNDCARPVDVHFEHLRYFAEWPDGVRGRLRPADRRHEIQAATLDSFGSGKEKLEMLGTHEGLPWAVCIDVSRFEGDAVHPVRPICFRVDRYASRERS